jgi:hypothetical protein
MSRSVAMPRKLGLLVAAEEPRREPVAPLDLAEERLAVLGVANSTRRDRERLLGAELPGLPAVVGEDVANPRDRRGKEAAALVDALAEPRDLQPADELLDPPVCDVGDEQARRVRAEVDGSHSRHGDDASRAPRPGGAPARGGRRVPATA